ncbi:hypothetical protein ACSAZL_08040 [Methanosarcina sp. T3]
MKSARKNRYAFLIENDYVDFAAIGRGMLADPEFANHVINSKPVNKVSIS